jgi:hypothetical protein
MPAFASAATSRPRRPLLGWTVAGALLLVLPGSLGAQEVRGRVLESGTRRPVMVATVTLLDSAMVAVDRTYTDESGVFVLKAGKAGSYFVLCERIGYKRTLDGILELGAGGVITVEFHVRPEPVALDTVSAEVARRRTSDLLTSVGFYERLAEKAAWFLTPEDLANRNETEVARLFRRAPRARVLEQPPITSLLFRGGSLTPGGSRIYGKRTEDPEGFCTPRVLVNGILAGSVITGVPGATLDDVVEVRDIAAIEVHTGPASLPLGYGGTSTTCTTILIWTKNGNGSGKG